MSSTSCGHQSTAGVKRVRFIMIQEERNDIGTVYDAIDRIVIRLTAAYRFKGASTEAAHRSQTSSWTVTNNVLERVVV
jgi:hypothetical protein